MRRRQQTAPISLFSFQDLMTGTIGVLIVIMLVLSLQLTTVLGTVHRMVGGDEEMPDLASEIEKLNARAVDLEVQLELEREDMRLLAQTQGSGSRTRLAREQSRLESTYERIEVLQEAIKRLEEQARASIASQDSGESESSEVRRLQQEADQLRATLEAQTRSNRLIYIANQSFERKPILVEVSEESIRIGGTTEAEATWEFTSPDPAARMASFVAWAQSVPTQTRYLLVLMKPSGLPLLEVIEEEVRKIGFEMGLDLIPEEKHALLDVDFGDP